MNEQIVLNLTIVQAPAIALSISQPPAVAAQLTGPPGAPGSTSLAGLSDVKLNSPSNNQVLTYNSTDNKWENQTPAAGSITKGFVIGMAAAL